MRRRQAGMGLIEVIIGLGLIAICIIGLNALVVAMIRGNLSARLNDQATQLAAAKISDLQHAGYDKTKLGTSSDVWWSAPSGSSVYFTRTTTVAEGSLPDTRSVTITMEWNDRGTRRSGFTTEIGK
jgi:Tfp pilus assembly protein PilV